MARDLMTVSTLIELLSDCDPAAHVLIGTQPSWPFEWSVAGIAVREDFADVNDRDEDADEDYGTFNLNGSGAMRGSDVVLLEGNQLAYGSKDMWDAARNY